MWLTGREARRLAQSCSGSVLLLDDGGAGLLRYGADAAIVIECHHHVAGFGHLGQRVLIALLRRADPDLDGEPDRTAPDLGHLSEDIETWPDLILSLTFANFL